ncbi:MAG: zf-TFIIB domain-containing protein [Acidobacteriia bacterium]|nr:zf-TFIIB domain-containing protein [Terriglobia bacterium]
MKRDCPSCRIPLTETSLGSVRIDECPKCNGIWFQDEELRLAKDKEDHDLIWLDFEIWRHADRFRVGTRKLECPDCHSSLVQVHYGDTPITADYCTLCRGVWLDKGEFEKIIRALEEEINSMSAREYLSASLQEAKEIFTGSESLLSEWRDLRAVLKLFQLRFFIEHQGLTSLFTHLPSVG